MGLWRRRSCGSTPRVAGCLPTGARRAPTPLAACLTIAACVSWLIPVTASHAAVPAPRRARLAGYLASDFPRAPRADGSLWRLANRHGVRPSAAVAKSRSLATPITPALSVSGGELEGTVTSAATKTPIAEVEVCAFMFEEPFFEECTTTGSGGEYTLSELPAGSYGIEYHAPAEAGLNYQRQYYDGKAREAEATPVAVVKGEIKAGIDAALLPGGEIAGAVTSASTKEAVSATLVCALDEVSELGECALTGSGGAYAIAGLGTGSYKVAFVPPEGGGYALQYYNNRAHAAEADPVAVTVGSTTTSINAALALQQGAPVSLSAPAISGSAVAGQTLTAIHGLWTNSPTSIVDEWGRCGSSGAIESCFTIATGASYSLTASDIGHTIRIREKAANAAGSGQAAFSLATAIVAPPEPARGLPVVGGGPAPATVSAAPVLQGGSGVLASTTVAVSASELKSLRDLLGRLLLPSGRGAKIAQLLKHKGYSLSLRAPSAQKLAIAWYLVPKGARVAGAKPVLAAAGSVSSAAAGAAKLTIRLTAKGRSLLSHAKRLKLTAKGSLDASDGAAVSAARSFTLTR